MKKLLSLVMALCMVFGFAACGTAVESAGTETDNTVGGSAEVTTENVTEEAGEPKTVALCENWGFDSGFFTPMSTENVGGGYGALYYVRNFYETLVELDNGEFVPGLAERWEISDDGLTYTFYLKEGIKFSDGTDFNAEAVKLNFDALPVIIEEELSFVGYVGSLIETTEVIDDMTVALHLTTPYYGVLKDLAKVWPYGIMSTAAYNDDLTLSDAVKNASFGTGPYMYDGEYDGTTYTFVRNPYYHGTAPDADSFTVSVISDPSAAALALRSGEIDLLSGVLRISYDTFKEFQEDAQLEAVVGDKLEKTQYISFNTTKAPFDNVTVRNAVALAIDKETICDTVYAGLVTPADSLLPDYYPYCGTQISSKGYDLEAAIQLLEDAGYTDSDGDGIREKDGQPLSVELPYMADNSSVDNVILMLVDQLKQLGIEVNASGMDNMSWYGVVMQDDWNLTLCTTYGPDYDPNQLFSLMDIDTQGNPAVWQVSLVLPDGDTIFKELNTCTDSQRIQKIYDYVLSEINEHSIMVVFV